MREIIRYEMECLAYDDTGAWWALAQEQGRSASLVALSRVTFTTQGMALTPIDTFYDWADARTAAEWHNAQLLAQMGG